MALKEIEKLKEKVDKDPNSKLFVPLAEEYKKEGMLDEAIQVLLTGIERQPAYMSARVSLGKIYLEKGMSGEARAEFESVISSIPDNLYAHKKLAEIYRASGEKELAVKAYRTILKLNSMDEDALSSLHELEGGGFPEDAREGSVGGETSEEDILESHIHEVSSEEVPYDESPFDDPDAGPAGQPRDDELNAFKESIFGEMGTGTDAPEEIIAEDLPEGEESLDSAYIAAEEVAEEDILTGLPEEEEESPVDQEMAGIEEGNVSGEAEETLESADAVDLTPEIFGDDEDFAGSTDAGVVAADRKVSEGDYAGAIRIYRRVLSENPGDRKALQRIEELRSLLRMMGRDKEELVARLSGFMEGLQKRHDEFLGRT